jgi:hypothetical protein
MGNPAAVRRKKSEKRRAKFETRFKGLAYVPKAVREEILKETAAAVAKK